MASRGDGSARSSSAFDALLGACPDLERVKLAAARVAGTDLPVLIEGETGTGKELLARAIHESSRRASGPLIPVNCACLSAELVESELFGHERGAFTGAAGPRTGKVAAAHHGTLFLDEIGDLPLPLQGRLLRFLQSGEVQRVGRDVPLHVDVRVVAATNRDLEEAASSGAFRADLYHRLACVKLRLPALRERGDDVIALARLLLGRFAAELGRPGLELGASALELLRCWHWPGNVRELANRVRAAALFVAGSVIEAVDLGAAQARTASGLAREAEASAAAPSDRETLTRALLRRHAGNLTLVARELRISRQTLYNRLRGLGIDYRSFRATPARRPA
ncbi:MAG: sigma 54-interacting transcriptional regulator [Thermodesulfobacteriota bacterium]